MTASGAVRKILRVAAQLALAAALLVYVSAGVLSGAALYTQGLYRTQPLSALGPLLDGAARKGDTSDVAAWLTARPVAETDAELRLLAPKSGALDAPVFLVIFRRELVLGRPKEALFWLQLGRFRLRYDLLRCGGTPGDARNFDALLSAAPSPQIDAFLRAHPAEMKGSLRRVLAFDAQYPAANDPARFCKIAVPGGTPASRDEWPLYRAALRRQTEEFIARKTAAAPPEKAGKDVSAPHRAVPRPKNRVK